MVLDPSKAMSQLQTSVDKLNEAEQSFINYWQGTKQLEPEINDFAEADLITVFQALQKSPIEYILALLKEFNKTPTSENLLNAIGLVQAYLKTTSSLEALLNKLAESYKALGSREKFQDVIAARNNLEKTLVSIQAEPGLADGEVGIEVLLQDSQSIRDSSQTPDANRSQITNRFIIHLQRSEAAFNTVSSENLALSALEILNIKQLIENWNSIAQNLQILTASADLSELKTSRAAIAQSIQIHDRLEAIYSYLAEAFRGNDLFNPAIL